MISGVVSVGVMCDVRMIAVVIPLVHYAFPGVMRGMPLGVDTTLALSFRVLASRVVRRDLAVRECVACTFSASVRMSHSGDATTAKVISRSVMTTSETTGHDALFAQSIPQATIGMNGATGHLATLHPQ